MTPLPGHSIRNLLQYAKPGPYQTKLSPEDELTFQMWVRKNMIPFDPNAPAPDYDMRGFWKQNPNYQHQPGKHFPDTFKTPFHETFSNESKYAKPNAPKWKGDVLIEQGTGRVIKDERKLNKNPIGKALSE